MAIEELMVLYDSAREGFLDGSLDFDADTIVAKAMGPGYIPSASTHTYGSDLPAGEIISTSIALTGKEVTDGIAKANDVTFENPPAGDDIVGVVLVDTTVDPGNQGRLLCYIGKDSEGAPLFIPTTGDDVRFRFGAGTKRIFKL